MWFGVFSKVCNIQLLFFHKFLQFLLIFVFDNKNIRVIKMDKILAEIAAKKKQKTNSTPTNTTTTTQTSETTTTPVPDTSNSNAAPQSKKYVRRGEAEKERERKYLEEQEEVRISDHFRTKIRSVFVNQLI